MAANGAYKDLTTGGLQRRRLTTTLSSSCEVMLSENLLEPKSTLNTGNVQNERTIAQLDQI